MKSLLRIRVNNENIIKNHNLKNNWDINEQNRQKPNWRELKCSETYKPLG